MSSITIMTTQGRAQLAAAVANAQSFPSAKIAVGDGNGATYVPNEAQVGLVHEVWRGNATVARTDDRVIFQAVVPAEVGGFTAREVGVLIGEVGAEQLFIISQHPSTEKIAAPANGSGPLPVTIAFSASAAEQAVLPIGSSDNATLQLSRAPHITVDGLVTEPPAEPADGSLYAIDAGAAGLFVGKGGWLVERVAGAWIYKQPPEKSVIRLAANGAWYQRDGVDWGALTFEDTSILWAQIQDPPATFLPSVHNHDDRYFTEAEADGRFVKKAGDTMSGYIEWANNVGFRIRNIAGVVNPGAGGHTYFKGADDNLYFDNYEGSVFFRRAGFANTLMLGGDGNVGVGTAAPSEKLHIVGKAYATDGYKVNAAGQPSMIKPGQGDGASATLCNLVIDSWWGIGFANTLPGAGVPVGENGVWIDARNGDVGYRSALMPNGDVGTSGKVLTGGRPNAWKIPAEIWGKKIIAIGYGTGPIMFAAAEPDTSYSAIVFNGIISNAAVNESTLRAGSISSKSTTGCTINAAAGSGGAGDTFYIIYR